MTMPAINHQQPRSISARAVSQARAYLEQRPSTRVTLPALARAVGTSPFALQRAFEKRYGVTPRAFQEALRDRQFRRTLRSGESVSAATFRAGFGSSSRVYERAAEKLGMTPGLYRRGAPGVGIRYTTVPTRFGHLLVAVTERGVCAVKLGADPSALERALREEFALADVHRTDAGRDEWLSEMVDKVAAHLPDGDAGAPDFPLDVVGTAFEWKVWKALMRIPAGRTRSYSAVARAIGAPKAARAVANACASNRIAVVVPCHRVVREDGTLGGYRWGVDVKAALLEGERAKV